MGGGAAAAAVVAGGAAATVVVAGAAAVVVAGVFGLNSVISIGGAILVSSMSPSGGCGVLAGGAGAGGVGGFKAELMSPLSASNAAFTLSANVFASAAVDRGVVCISTTCFKLGILSYNALDTPFDLPNFVCMYDSMLVAAL